MEMYLFLDIACNAPLLCQQWQPKTARCFQMSSMSGEGKGSYSPEQLSRKKWWAHLDSNQGPTGYEPVALAN